MSYRKVLAISSAISLSLSIVPEMARAADQGYEEIVVTARRVQEKLQNVPISVSAIQGENLEKLNINAATDLQNHTPNLYIRSDSLGGVLQPSFILRGQVQTLTTDENVALYVAEVPQSTRAISSMFYDIGQVQILKGPQGTLFGKNSNSGAIVITPNRPTNDFGGWVKGQGGNYGFYEFTGVLNVPVARDKFALRFAGDVTRQNGTVKNTLPGYADYDNQKHQSVRISGLFTPTDRIENLTVFDYLHRNEVPTPWILLSSGNGALTPYTDQAFQQQLPLGKTQRPGVTGLYAQGPDGSWVSESAYAEVLGISNVTTFDINDNVKLKNIFGYRKEKAIGGQDMSAVHGYPIPALFGGFLALSDTTDRHELTSKSDEFQVIGNFLNNRLTGIAGAFWSKADDQVREWGVLQLAVNRASNPKIDSVHQFYESKAVFAEATYDFSDVSHWLNGVKYTAGARLTWDKRSMLQRYFTRSLTTSGAPSAFGPQTTLPAGVCGLLVPGTATLLPGTDAATCTHPNADTYKGFSWNQTLAWQVNDHVNLYASYKKGYKSGGMNAFLRNIPELQSFNPETLTVYELGAKTDGTIGEAKWFLNGAYFAGRYRNLQTQTVPDFSADFGLGPQSVVALVIVNDVPARMYGVELEGGLRYRDVEVTGNYSYLNQKYLGGFLPATSAELRAGTGYPLANTPYPGAPKQTAGGAVTYKLSWLPENWGDISATTSVAWHGTAPAGVPVTSVAEIPSYVVVDLSAEWANVFGRPIDLGFWMKNAANNVYKVTCLDNSTALSYFSCQFARQRTFGFSLKYRFGADAQ